MLRHIMSLSHMPPSGYFNLEISFHKTTCISLFTWTHYRSTLLLVIPDYVCLVGEQKGSTIAGCIIHIYKVIEYNSYIGKTTHKHSQTPFPNAVRFGIVDSWLNRQGWHHSLFLFLDNLILGKPNLHMLFQFGISPWVYLGEIDIHIDRLPKNTQKM